MAGVHKLNNLGDSNFEEPRDSKTQSKESVNNQLDGFDNLWKVSDSEVNDFVTKKAGKKELSPEDEIKSLKGEIKERNFDINKFRWQMKEREKELQKLYNEVNHILDLNQGLNEQLQAYKYLEEEYQDLKRISKLLSEKLAAQQLENLELREEIKAKKTEKKGFFNFF